MRKNKNTRAKKNNIKNYAIFSFCAIIFIIVFKCKAECVTVPGKISKIPILPTFYRYFVAVLCSIRSGIPCLIKRIIHAIIYFPKFVVSFLNVFINKTLFGAYSFIEYPFFVGFTFLHNVLADIIHVINVALHNLYVLLIPVLYLIKAIIYPFRLSMKVLYPTIQGPCDEKQWLGSWNCIGQKNRKIFYYPNAMFEGINQWCDDMLAWIYGIQSSDKDQADITPDLNITTDTPEDQYEEENSETEATESTEQHEETETSEETEPAPEPTPAPTIDPNLVCDKKEVVDELNKKYKNLETNSEKIENAAKKVAEDK